MRFVILFLLSFSAAAADPRMCFTEPKRDVDGTILRSAAPLHQFQKLYPCPSTNERVGPCPGWHKDHVIPLACGGCDTVANLQWLPVEIKSAPGILAKDRWERSVYCGK